MKNSYASQSARTLRTDIFTAGGRGRGRGSRRRGRGRGEARELLQVYVQYVPIIVKINTINKIAGQHQSRRKMNVHTNTYLPPLKSFLIVFQAVLRGILIDLVICELELIYPPYME